MAALAGQIPMPPIAHVIPMKGVAAEHGRIVFEAQADERHLNPLGGVHGGFTAGEGYVRLPLSRHLGGHAEGRRRQPLCPRDGNVLDPAPMS